MMRRAAALALSCLMAAPAAAETALTYGTYLPEVHTLNAEGVKPLAQRLSEESDGEISLRLFTGGIISKASGAVDAIRDGLVSAGKITDVSVSKQLPHSYLITLLALLGEDPLVMGPAVSELKLLHCEGCLEDAAKENIIPMAYYSTTPHLLVCKEPVHSLDQLQGRKVRATGAYAKMYSSFGMVPVNLPHEESYEGFKRGQIDCADSVDAWLRTLSIWDAAKYVIDMNIGTYHGGIVWAMNADVWKSMPADHKVIVRRNMPILVADVLFGYVEDKNSVRKEAKSKNVIIQEPSSDYVEAVEAYREIELARIRKIGREQGIEGSDELIDTFLGMIEKWEEINAEEVKGSKDNLISALNREIYSKVEW